jgi:hypothetical protein
MYWQRRKIRLIEGNAKCRYLKRDFAAGVYLSEAQNPIPPPPLHPVYMYTVHLFARGEEGEVNQREG